MSSHGRSALLGWRWSCGERQGRPPIEHSCKAGLGEGSNRGGLQNIMIWRVWEGLHIQSPGRAQGKALHWKTRENSVSQAREFDCVLSTLINDGESLRAAT